MSSGDYWNLYEENWFMAITMVLGSFIAGASSEGGGAVAFPVMTLLFDITPPIARNFGLAIQSVGMVMASYLILIRKFKVAQNYLLLVSIGGVFGITLSSYYLVPLVPPAFAKMLFVTFWLSFGLVLAYANIISKRKPIDELPKVNPSQKTSLIGVGLIGGALSGILGSGIDIFSFSYVTLRYNLSEKVATPTSVIIMAINSLTGFILHALVIKDFELQAFNYWLVCIPVVIIGAPLGAHFINSRTRNFVFRLLLVIILVQFIGALLILKPSNNLYIFSAITFLFGILFFSGFIKMSNPKAQKKMHTKNS